MSTLFLIAASLISQPNPMEAAVYYNKLYGPDSGAIEYDRIQNAIDTISPEERARRAKEAAELQLKIKAAREKGYEADRLGRIYKGNWKDIAELRKELDRLEKRRRKGMDLVLGRLRYAIKANIVARDRLHKPEMRKWVDVTGKHETEAKFVKATKYVVTLEKPSAELIDVAVRQLSPEDRDYVLGNM